MSLEAKKDNLRRLFLSPNTVELAIEMEKSLNLFGDDPRMKAFKDIVSRNYSFYSPNHHIGFINTDLNKHQLKLLYILFFSDKTFLEYVNQRQTGSTTLLAIFLGYKLATEKDTKYIIIEHRLIHDIMIKKIKYYYNHFKSKSDIIYVGNKYLKTLNNVTLVFESGLKKLHGCSFDEIYIDNVKLTKINESIKNCANKIVKISTQ